MSDTPPAEQPDEVPESTTAELLVTLTAEIRGLRDDVRSERIGRRSNRTLGVVAIGALVVGLGAGAKAYVDQRAISCESRAQSRTETRAAIVAAVDEVARFADLDEVERRSVSRQVSARVATELPPPECIGTPVGPRP